MKTKIDIKKLIKLLSIMTVMLVFVFPTKASAAQTGSCGPNATYTYENGMLTISGDGGMKDYGRPEDIPWYKYRDEVTAVIVTDGITGVGNLAFCDMKNLFSASFPSSMKAIGEYAFSNCERLTAITLPDSLQSIGTRAFERCTSISNIKIPANVTNIGSGAFYRCYGLTTITVPKSVKTMGNSVFAYCKGLITANIKADIDEVPMWTFYGCGALTDVSFSSKITEVGENAFARCDSMTDLTFDNKQQNIAEIKNNSSGTDTAEPGVTPAPQGTPAPEGSSSQEGTANASPAPQGSSAPEGSSSQEGTANASPSPEGSVSTSPQATVKPTASPQPTASATQKEIIETENAVITVTKPQEETETLVADVVAENKNGVTEAVTELKTLQEQYESMVVNIQLKNSNTLDKSVIKQFAEKNVILNVTTLQNSMWTFDCKNIQNKKIKNLDLTVSWVEKVDLTTEEKQVFGDAKAYSLSFKKDFAYAAEVRVPVGVVFARQYATLYMVDEVVTKNLQSVLIDNEGRASFAFSKDSAPEGYVVVLNLENKGVQQDAYIPEHMQGEYTGLVDEYGTRYVVTGHKSAWGIELNEFTRYVVVFFVAVVVIVGSVTYVITKQREIKNKYRK